VSAPGDGFGLSIAISGDKLVVGALSEDAYIYTRSVGSGNDWLTTSTVAVDESLGPNGPQIGTVFGYSVDISDEGTGWVAVGATGAHDVAGSVNACGAVFLFDTNGAYRTAVSAATPELNQYFGNSVALSMVGDTGHLVVGSMYTDNVETSAGKVFVFENSGGSWVQQSDVGAPVPISLEQFGWDVGVSPDGKIVTGTNEHAAYAFE
jgi:hypothetical protein